MPIELIAAPHTPFDSSGNLHLEVIEEQAALFARTAVAGVFICGSTGEGVLMTTDERIQMADAWIAAGRTHQLKVLVHAGHNSGHDAAVLAQHASNNGADGVAVMAPSFFKPTSAADLMSYLTPIAAACQSVPFYFYDIPSMSGVRISTPEMLRHLSSEIPNFAGIKYTKDDLIELQECLAFSAGRWPILFGCDEMLLAGYALGATGAVGSTYNFAPQLYQKLVAAFDAGDLDEARRLQLLSVRIIRCCQQYGYSASAKAAMKLVGVDCGPVRAPLRNLTDNQLESLTSQLQQLFAEI